MVVIGGFQVRAVHIAMLALVGFLSVFAALLDCPRRLMENGLSASKLTPNRNGGAGFYRFPAWARTKPNDVSPGHAILG
jgi:hypothetical protein